MLCSDADAAYNRQYKANVVVLCWKLLDIGGLWDQGELEWLC